MEKELEEKEMERRDIPHFTVHLRFPVNTQVFVSHLICVHTNKSTPVFPGEEGSESFEQAVAGAYPAVGPSHVMVTE